MPYIYVSACHAMHKPGVMLECASLSLLLMAIPATCVCVIANKAACSVYISEYIEVTAIETVCGNSDITVGHIAW